MKKLASAVAIFACAASPALAQQPTAGNLEKLSEFKTTGTPIGGNGLLIAAHAKAAGATVVTANADEFRRVRGLKVENWVD